MAAQADEGEPAHDEPAEPVGEAEDGLAGLPARCPGGEQGGVDRRVGEGGPLEVPEGDHRRSEAIRRSGASASSGQSAGSSGHHAYWSCSSSGTTSAPAASQAWPTNITSSCGRRTSASARTRSGSTPHSSRSSRDSVSAGCSNGSTAPPAPSAQRPAQDDSQAARRPASQRPSASRITHSAAMLLEASPSTSRSAQRTGWSSRTRRPSRSLWFTSRAASPSWLGEPRSRSAVIARSAASARSAGGSKCSSCQTASMRSTGHGPRARMAGSTVTAATLPLVAWHDDRPMSAEGPGPTAPRRPVPAPQPLSVAQLFAGIVGVLLVAAGSFGFAVDSAFDTGSDVSGDKLLGLEVNGWHNLVHIATGLLLLVGAGSRSSARGVCRIFGIAYLVVTIAGIAGGGDAFGLIPINPADDVLHAVLAFGALLASHLSKERRDALARDRVLLAAEEEPSVVGPGTGHVGGPRVPRRAIDTTLPAKPRG